MSNGRRPSLREAQAADLPQLVAMLADDALGQLREDVSEPLNPAYESAFRAITDDPNNALVIAELDDCIAGMLQLTFIPCLSHTGAWRCQVEGVRIASTFRGMGLGTSMMQYAIDAARARHCRLVQLTSDKQRADALRFYTALGFEPTHEGFKLKL